MARVQTHRVLDRSYPHLLRDLPSPPDPLCVRGELLPAPTIAIVGTRTPSKRAMVYAHDLAFRLARSGVTIWSGGAKGIDSAAHCGALDAGGLTVAVVGTGLDHCYPSDHAALYEEIVLTGGALVSPFEPTQHATLTTFPQRNAVLAALTQATVVVQAPIKSGARSTAASARRLRRPLFVVPAAPWEVLGAGNLAELALGATALTDEAQLFKFLGVPFSGPRHAAARHAMARQASAPTAKMDQAKRSEVADPESESFLKGLPAPSRAVFEAARHVPRHVDDLCVETGLSAALVHGALLTLTLEAVLVEGPAGWFRRATKR